MSSSNAAQSAGQLETRGIEPVPEAECNGHPLQLFWVWFAANISILGLPLGATLVAFRGLAIWQAIIVAIIGAAGSFAVVGIISTVGLSMFPFILPSSIDPQSSLTAWNASSNEVLDWVKHTPALMPGEVNRLEQWLRKGVVQHWSAAAARDLSAQPHLARTVATVEAWRDTLRTARPLAQWLPALRAVLEQAGQWQGLSADPAGMRVLVALRLQDGQQAELDGWGDSAGRRMALAEFTRWAKDVLEAGRYVAAQAADAPVVVVPLPQLLARPFAAAVLPGCDEKRLQAAPEPSGESASCSIQTDQ